MISSFYKNIISCKLLFAIINGVLQNKCQIRDINKTIQSINNKQDFEEKFNYNNYCESIVEIYNKYCGKNNNISLEIKDQLNSITEQDIEEVKQIAKQINLEKSLTQFIAFANELYMNYIWKDSQNN